MSAPGAAIDRLDLALIRLLEEDGRAVTDGRTEPAGVVPAEAGERTSRLVSDGIIRGWGVSLFVPALLGGEWHWAAAAVRARGAVDTSLGDVGRAVFIAERVENACLPRGAGANLGFLFYSPDLTAAGDFFQHRSGVERVEVFRVAGYSFPVAQAMSRDEWRLVRALDQAPTATIDALAQAAGQTREWTVAKLDRLLRRPGNPTGPVWVLPELDWRAARNFLHVHFILETGLPASELMGRVADQGLAVVAAPEQPGTRRLQVEADLWGLDELVRGQQVLTALPETELTGLAWSRSTRVERGWVRALIRENGGEQ